MPITATLFPRKKKEGRNTGNSAQKYFFVVHHLLRASPHLILPTLQNTPRLPNICHTLFYAQLYAASKLRTGYEAASLDIVQVLETGTKQLTIIQGTPGPPLHGR